MNIDFSRVDNAMKEVDEAYEKLQQTKESTMSSIAKRHDMLREAIESLNKTVDENDDDFNDIDNSDIFADIDSRLNDLIFLVDE